MDSFDLTSWGFIITVLVVTVLVFAALVWFLPRLPRRGVVAYLVQAFAMLLVAVLILVSVAAWMNKDNNWYTSWDDLFGASETANSDPTEHYGAEVAKAVAPAPIQGRASDLQKHPLKNPIFSHRIAHNTSSSQYFTVQVPGKVSGQTYSVMVWLPKSYLKHPDRFYPVIVGFTGIPGSPKTYSQSLNYGQMIENAVKHGKMREAIFVVPAVFPGSYDTECVDGAREQSGGKEPRAETYVTHDLVPWIRENLRVSEEADAWSLVGYSAGGFCSAMLSMRYPDLFGSGQIYSGYFSPVYAADQAWTAAKEPRYDLERIAAEEPPNVRLYYYSSRDDELSWPSVESFKDKVRGPTSLTLDSIKTGGHRQDVWEPGMVKGLHWLGRTSPYFAPLT